jgi:hypothetical protein
MKGGVGGVMRHEVKHQTVTPGVLKCIHRGCKLTFTKVTGLKEHAAKHGGLAIKSKERSIVCNFPGCNLSFDSRSHLANHKSRVHKFVSVACLPLLRQAAQQHLVSLITHQDQEEPE